MVNPIKKPDTPSEIRKLLKLEYEPDSAQTEVIIHPISEPLLVVAGAGSGKTETMANRIGYMLHNPAVSNQTDAVTVEPEEILGLTFTRKAVLELNARVRLRVNAVMTNRTQKESSSPIMNAKYPQISTYNSFAAQIVNEYGIYSGIDPNARLITDADRYLICRQALLDYFTDDLLKGMTEDEQKEISVDSLTSKILHFIDDANNNFVDFEEVDQFNQSLLRYYNPEEWEIKSRRGNAYKSAVESYGGISEPTTDKNKLRKTFETRSVIIKIAKRFEELKADQRVIDYSDQIALAYRITSENPQVGSDYRNRYKYVILDEYQDTSASQVELLKAVFGTTHPIVAVGDPNQSIYQWRGASSSGILQFNNDFTLANGEPSRRIELLISRRNDDAILDVANCVSRKLVDSNSSPLVPKLVSRPDSGPGNVEIKLCAAETRKVPQITGEVAGQNSSPSDLVGNETDSQFTTYNDDQFTTLSEKLDFEVETVVDYIQEHFSEHNRRITDQIDALTESVSSPADVDKAVRKLKKLKRRAVVLCPIRSDFTKYVSALSEKLIPVEVVGLGGLLGLPEIQDVLCYLHVLCDSSRGDMMLRLLSSPRICADKKMLDILHKLVINPKRQANSTDNSQTESISTSETPMQKKEQVQNTEHEVRTLVDVVRMIGSSEPSQPTSTVRKAILNNYEKDSLEYSSLMNLSKLLNLLSDQQYLPVDQFVNKVVNLSGIRTELQIGAKLKVYSDAKGTKLPASSRTAFINASTSSVDAFLYYVNEYAKYALNADLAQFLEYLQIVAEKENELDQPVLPPNPDAVQLTTIHSAKGLEWDVVCSVSNTVAQYLKDRSKVYGVSKGTKSRGLMAKYPNYQPRPSMLWVKRADILPDNLRLNARSLEPLFEAENVKDLPDFDYYMGRYEDGNAMRLYEERRRLAYVAFTRAKSHLLITASLFYRENANATLPTPFFAEILENCNPSEYAHFLKMLDKLFKPFQATENDRNPQQRKMGERGSWTDYQNRYHQNWYWQATHQLARELVGEFEELKPFAVEELPEKVQLLLEQRNDEFQRREHFEDYVEIPQHLSTSALVKLRSSKAKFLADISRPMPEEPRNVNDIGTRFHEWVQKFYTSTDFEAHLAGQFVYRGDSRTERLSIDKLVTNFLSSAWSKVKPVEVEKEIYYTDGGHSVVARIDAVFDIGSVDDILKASGTEVEPNCRTLIVDWKTGRAPVSEQDRRVKGVQLAAYTHAWDLLQNSVTNSSAQSDSNQTTAAAFVYIGDAKMSNFWYFSPTELTEIYQEVDFDD